MWASRGVFLETLYAVSQLTKVMSRPNGAAFKAAMHLIAYMHYARHEGITFSSRGSKIPFAMSDASNKGDPKDSKRAYGFVVHWQGGPILAASRKLPHCSSATAANEYMALSMTTKQIVWMRQLMLEVGLAETVAQPTLIYADNKTANQWANDEMITQGNQWILEAYHYVKDMGPSGEGIVTIKHVPTKLNLADVFTKGVPKEVLDRLAGYLLGRQDVRELIREIEQAEKTTEGNSALKGIGDAGGESRTEPPGDK